MLQPFVGESSHILTVGMYLTRMENFQPSLGVSFGLRCFPVNSDSSPVYCIDAG